MVKARQLAVVWKRVDLEVDRPLTAVRVPLRLQGLHGLDHRSEVGLISGSWILLDRFETERRRVVTKCLDVTAVYSRSETPASRDALIVLSSS